MIHYITMARIQMTIWNWLVYSWMLQVVRLCRKLNINSSPFEMFVIDWTGWIVTEWPWMWETGLIRGGAR